MSLLKKKRMSKKDKNAWRKTDIKDVEEYLEEQRQEERIGSFAEKQDEDLFTLDTQAQEPKINLITPKQKRKLNAKKPLRSLEALENTSKVQDPIVKRNSVRQKKSGRNIEEEIRNPTKPRHFKANKDRGLYYEKLDKKEKTADRSSKFTKDLWHEVDIRDELPGLKDEKGWVSKSLAMHTLKNVGKYVVKAHDSLRHRTTKAKNFEAPHPGMSYNPSLSDHQDLIKNVVENEEKIIKQTKHLKRVTTQMFSKVTPEERDALRLKEMSAGLEDEFEYKDDRKPTNDSKKCKKTATVVDETSPIVENSDSPYNSMNKPVENKKKSKQTRHKELKQKELQKQHAEKKVLKKQIADLNRIKSLKAEVLEEEAELNETKKRRKKAALKKKFEPKRLGRLAFVKPDADVNMPEDIEGNLRNVKPESSLLVDRFKNFQKRNLLPTSVATGKQKNKKIKRFPRSTHKDPGVSYQMLREQRKSAAAIGVPDIKV